MTFGKIRGELEGSPCTRKSTGIFIFALFASCSLLGASADDARSEPQQQMNVLELFTSQGCSSCPPADALLNDLAKRDDIVALSFPVSYWDYLGWKDTLAKKQYNDRQYTYAQIRGDRDIYTPQLVVNGMTHVIGSHPDAIQAAIKDTEALLKDSQVPLSITVSIGKVEITAGDAPAGGKSKSGKLWVVCYAKSVEVSIGRGENNGRQISYTNVARELIPAGDWNGHNAQYTVNIPKNESFDAVAVLLQDRRSQIMLAAATSPLPSD
jgi:hypothetical protein